jgi:hypothetical protein
MGSVALAEGDKPSATLTTKETEVGLIIGGDWGKGTLSFDGSEYAFQNAGSQDRRGRYYSGRNQR